MDATLELDRVRKSYDGTVAVDDLSLSIAPGTIFGLLGPNGAGKTSAIRMMVGILLPDSGSVRVLGAPLTRAVRRRIGYLPEERGLYRRMTVKDNLVFFAELAGVSARDARARGLEWTKRLGLDGWFERRVEELSKGMQQKIQFIAALIHDPEFLVMDEPFGGLDPINANELRDVVIDLKRNGRTILLSTHRMDHAEKMCDEICFINRGKALLRSNLREAKARAGRRFIRIELDGSVACLARNPLVENFQDYGNHAELTLHADADSQQFLREAMSKARVLQFEVREPSLEELFIEVVGAEHA